MKSKIQKTALVTGAAGFIGFHIATKLLAEGWRVIGLDCMSDYYDVSLKESRENILLSHSKYRSIHKKVESDNVLMQLFSEEQPDIVIHMAAQPLVRLSYKNPVETYSTNVMGTVNVLEAVRNSPSVKAVVNVTTDKCYHNKEWLWGYREDEAMGGHDPYSSSKGCSELVTSAYRSSFFNSSGSAKIASARAGNVIGGGDWADDRLIPDILSSFDNRVPVAVRNPSATRPWQHVLEPLSGYLRLAESLHIYGDEFAGAWNFGPNDDDVKPVSAIVEYMAQRWGDGASWVHDKSTQPHEAQLLKLDISKARELLKWTPKWTLYKSLDLIVDWQKDWSGGNDVKARTLKQIKQYELS